MYSTDEQFFLPALTIEEAIRRIYSLTGARDSGTRGEKRAVVALRDALGLDIGTGATSDLMAAAIADALSVPWQPDDYTDRHKLTLQGLNALLEGASEAYAKRALGQLNDIRPDLLSGPEWVEFKPARSKIEAVNRISELTGSGAERLGPGGKEHKRVLINLVHGLNLTIAVTTKHGTAAALAEAFDAPWSDLCVSTQGTITLTGLNVLLAGAEKHLGRLGEARAMLFGTPEAEGRALGDALAQGFEMTTLPDGAKRVIWDGRACVRWLLDNGTGQAMQSEWPGFYWEYKARSILAKKFAPNPQPPRAKYGKEPFDFALNYVWDLKSHTESWRNPDSSATRSGRSRLPLNDAASMDACIDDQGLGFLVCNGVAIEDIDDQFKAWHNALKTKPSAPSNSDKPRPRKASFEPTSVDVYWFANPAAFDAAVAAGYVVGFRQGPQAPKKAGSKGASRNPKYHLTHKAIGEFVHVERFKFPSQPASTPKAAPR